MSYIVYYKSQCNMSGNCDKEEFNIFNTKEEALEFLQSHYSQDAVIFECERIAE